MKINCFDTTSEGGSEGRACYRGSRRRKTSLWPPVVLGLIVAAGAASAQTRIDLKTQGKSVDFSGANSTKPSKTGTVLPATCSVGETFLKTDAPAGQNFYACIGNVWSLQGSVIPSVTGFANMVLATDGSALMWKALGGDASGPPASLTVSRLQGRSLSAAGPTSGQALVWNGATTQWEPQTIGFGQIAGSVTDAQVGIGINAAKIGSGAVSNTALGYLANVTADLQAQLNGKAATNQPLAGDTGGNLGAIIVMGLRNRAVSAAPPANGQALVWNSGTGQWEPQNQAGGASSVFGRTGAVTAQPGDYSFGQITGTVADAQVSPGINASKIGTGFVTSTAFGYLSNVTSDLQGQLNGKAAAGHTHTVSGDVTGSLGTTTVTALQNRAVSSEPPTNGQVLVFNMSTNHWEPQSPASNPPGSYSSSFVGQTAVTIQGTTHQLGTANLLVGCYDTAAPNMRVQPNTVSVSPTSYDVVVTFATAQSGRCVVSAGGGGGAGGSSGGASMASQLRDFGLTWTSGAMLTLGSNCSPTTPCNVRIGNNVHRFVNGTTVTVTGGTGVAYIYIDAGGALTVGHNLTLSCNSPCTAVSGITAFPVNSIPLYMWTATGGNWDASGGVDERAALSTKILTPGTGLVILDTGSVTNISVDAAVVPTYVTATASLGFGSIATGTCATDKTFNLPGAAVGDVVAPGWPSGIEAGLLGNMRVSSPNTVAVRICNLSGAAITPANAGYKATIVRSF